MSVIKADEELRKEIECLENEVEAASAMFEDSWKNENKRDRSWPNEEEFYRKETDDSGFIEKTDGPFNSVWRVFRVSGRDAAFAAASGVP